MAEPAHSDQPLLQTPLHAEHVALGARMVPFAGYDMPVQYPTGILTEHNWTREHAGLFDVSHMGQAFLVAEDKSHETVARALEALIPADVLNLKPNQQRYSQLLDEDGGILDAGDLGRAHCRGAVDVLAGDAALARSSQQRGHHGARGRCSFLPWFVRALTRPARQREGDFGLRRALRRRGRR